MYNSDSTGSAFITVTYMVLPPPPPKKITLSQLYIKEGNWKKYINNCLKICDIKCKQLIFVTIFII